MNDLLTELGRELKKKAEDRDPRIFDRLYNAYDKKENGQALTAADDDFITAYEEMLSDKGSASGELYVMEDEGAPGEQKSSDFELRMPLGELLEGIAAYEAVTDKDDDLPSVAYRDTDSADPYIQGDDEERRKERMIDRILTAARSEEQYLQDHPNEPDELLDEP